MVIVLRSIHRVEKYTHFCNGCICIHLYVLSNVNTIYIFYVKRDCLLFSLNVKLFFEFFVMKRPITFA